MSQDTLGLNRSYQNGWEASLREFNAQQVDRNQRDALIRRKNFAETSKITAKKRSHF